MYITQTVLFQSVDDGDDNFLEWYIMISAVLKILLLIVQSNSLLEQLNGSETDL